MKILAPGIERFDVGGGATFLRNFAKAMQPFGNELFGDVARDDYDVLFIAGASLCDRDVFERAVRNGKKIVIRVDNILEDKRNRNSGMPRMIEFASKADLIIYQSEWARKFLSPIIGDGPVVHNGVDTSIFHPSNEYLKKEIHEPRTFVYSKFSRGDGKNVNEVVQWWREHHIRRPQDKIFFIGKYSDDTFQVNHPFEFHNNEQWEYLGMRNDQEALAEELRRFDYAILPYFADACSNQILEAQACGIPVLYDHSGGTPEIAWAGEEIRHDMWLSRDELIGRLDAIKQTIFENPSSIKGFSLEKMGAKYNAMFRILFQMDGGAIEAEE